MTGVIKKIMLFGVTEYGNHGVEAIVRGTLDIIQQYIPNIDIVISSVFPEKDRLYNIKPVSKYVEYKILKSWSVDWCIASFIRVVLKNSVLAGQFVQRQTINEGKKSELILSVGGDNYCYKKPYGLMGISHSLKKRNKKIVLWGASISKDFIDKDILDNLREFDLIVARESLTYNTLKKMKLDNVKLYPDPAFFMKAKEVKLDNEWNRDNIIGINISPLILNYEVEEGILINSFKVLADYILNNTDYNIALIPHVRSSMSDDMVIISQLYRMIDNKDRVFIVNHQYNAMELKYIISKCKLFIATRTHASIAAYSTCVPTLVAGYSVKSKGIAKDIFGTYDDYVLPVQSLKKENELTDAFIWLCGHQNEIRAHLQKFMPSYIEKAGQSGRELQKLLDE
jgi:colanic acid/amylovoran biosynthesis protein